VNRLTKATSPYLLQHADNPVDWWEWSEEAFAEARASDRPVLLSIGYAACHWCHVIDHPLRNRRLMIKSQVSGIVLSRSDSSMAAVEHGFRCFVYHFRVSLGVSGY